MQDGTPYFSICIPQYNRTSFLIEALQALSKQTFRDFEVCISDDCSPDGRHGEILTALQNLDLRHVYYWQPANLRYDGNLRAAIGLAHGEYCLLMGNDDRLAEPGTLQRLYELMSPHRNVGVVITNYKADGGAVTTRRVPITRIAGSGPGLAARCFRNFSFVSGVVLRRDRAVAHATAKWDGAEMYQMYVGCRILGEGYKLLEVSDAMIVQAIQIPGETVDSYAARPRLNPCPINERRTPLVDMGRLVFDAIQPYSGRKAPALAFAVILQILLFPYAYWVIEYRRVQSWKYSVGICLGMRPSNVLGSMRLYWTHLQLLKALYLGITVAGLCIPIGVFDSFRSRLYALAKSVYRHA